MRGMGAVVHGLSTPWRQPVTEHSRESEADPFSTYVLPELDVLYRVAMSITRNRADAEDLVQDTLLRAYRAIERFDGRHPVPGC